LGFPGGLSGGKYPVCRMACLGKSVFGGLFGNFLELYKIFGFPQDPTGFVRLWITGELDRTAFVPGGTAVGKGGKTRGGGGVIRMGCGLFFHIPEKALFSRISLAFFLLPEGRYPQLFPLFCTYGKERCIVWIWGDFVFPQPVEKWCGNPHCSLWESVFWQRTCW